MKPISSFRARERLPRALMRRGQRRPRQTLVLWALLCLAATPTFLQLEVEASAESALDRRHEAWRFYQRSLELFGGDEVVVVALESAAPFATGAIGAVGRVSTQLESLDGLRRVDSLATQPVIRVDAHGTLQLDPAADGFGSDGAVTSDVVRALAVADRIAPRSLVSDDGRVLAINLVMGRQPSAHYDEVLSAVAGVVDSVPSSLVSARVSGVPVFQHETSLHTRRELLRFTPLALVVIAALLTLIFRTARGAVFLLVSGSVGSWLMVSGIAAAGVPLSFTMVILPPVLLALAAAYGMHVLTAASASEADGSGGGALEERVGDVATPVALSGLTTAIGFLAAGVIEIDAVRYVGIFGSLGVLWVVFFTLTGLPALIALWPLPSLLPRGFHWLAGPAARRLGRIAGARRAAVFAGSALLGLVAAAGIKSVEVNTDATHWFRTGTWVRDDYEAIRRDLSGISPVNIVVDLDRAQGRASVLDPEILAAIDRLSEHLGSLPEVGKSVSIADPLRQIHEGFAGSADAGLPETRALAEQYLLLLESVDHIGDLVTPDRTSANVMLRVDNNGSARLLAVGSEAQSWWQEHGPSGARARPTGIMYEFARSQDAITYGQAASLALALAAIGLVLLLAFGRPASALATLAPNVAPLVGVYGAMGALGVPLDAGTVFVGSLALGIAVDDTVHLASAYYEEVERASPADAIARALNRVLPAISYTTVAVGFGFSLLALSEFSFIRNLGLLMGGVMTLCLIADVLLLPALLAQIDGNSASEASN